MLKINFFVARRKICSTIKLVGWGIKLVNNFIKFLKGGQSMAKKRKKAAKKKHIKHKKKKASKKKKKKR